MKSTIAVAAAAVLSGAASASDLHQRHGHKAFHAVERDIFKNETECGCTTIYSTYYGEATLSFPPPPATTSTYVAPTGPPVVPTPVPNYCSTTGVYTFPAHTVTLTETTTVAVPSTTSVPAGTHPVGGVTTVVTTATTVTCPYPTVETSEGVTTSVIKTTEYVCPSAGTYTIAPSIVTVDKPTTVVVPVVTTYCPGTYTQPEVITTVVNTNTVVYCPFEALPTTSSSAPAVTATYTAEPIETYAPATYAPAPSAPAESPKPKPKPSAKPSGGFGGEAGTPWGTTFTPYNPEDGTCMSKERVESEITTLANAGMKIIRTYSTDCNTLEYVGAACEAHGIQMIVGIFIDSPGCSPNDANIDEQIRALKSWAKWEIVPLVVVGNEAVLNGFCTPKQLADLINHCKTEFSGFTGMYTTAETTNVWQMDESVAALCPCVDAVGLNAHPFFNYETSASDAGEFVKGQLDIVSGLCGKDAYVMETGWPSEGSSSGSAIASHSEQEIAVHAIIKSCGERSILFSLHDDKWKPGNTACGACEQHWGISGVLGLTY
jgi:exo-beta-1,3-glucanase (GH17 family)